MAGIIDLTTSPVYQPITIDSDSNSEDSSIEEIDAPTNSLAPAQNRNVTASKDGVEAKKAAKKARKKAKKAEKRARLEQDYDLKRGKGSNGGRAGELLGEVIGMSNDSSSSKAGKSNRRERRAADQKAKELSKTSSRRSSPPLLPLTSNGSAEALFFVDLEPTVLPGSSQQTTGTPVASASKIITPRSNDGLLLPPHVSVFTPRDANAPPVEAIQALEVDSDEDEDFITFLDYDADDRQVGLVRYYDDPEKQSRNVTLHCKHCGADGHLRQDCTVQICLTCGARDEHSTWNCPISKVCFRCGMKGHMVNRCPNRPAAQDSLHDCGRCGSSQHNSNECHTMWRIYNYYTEEERSTVLQRREGMRGRALGQGGEGYIGSDQWCANCGMSGHLMDACMYGRVRDYPREPGAFSSFNTTTGPFGEAGPSDPAAAQGQSANLHEDANPENWDANVPSNVGRKARRKEAARLAEAARDDMDDPDDWFGNSKNVRHRGNGALPTDPRRQSEQDYRRGGDGGGKQGRKITFGAMSSQPRGLDTVVPKPTLQDRLGDRYDVVRSYDTSGSRRRSDNDERSRSSRNRDKDTARGPRYRGGYSR